MAPMWLEFHQQWEVRVVNWSHRVISNRSDALESAYAPLSINGGVLSRLAIDVLVTIQHMRRQIQTELHF